MRIRQGRVSNSLLKFKRAYLEKFNLREPFNYHEPVVFFGLYDDKDYSDIQLFKSNIIVVWCGTDSLMINPVRLSVLQKIKANHISKNKFIFNDLIRLKIKSIVIPITWQDINLEPNPLGNRIFTYGKGAAYGEQYFNEIEKKTGIEIVRTVKDTYSKESLIAIYKTCFINLRLTKHDGIPNTVIEMGMMGRRSIYNGDIPTTIKYKTVDDIIKSVIKEYQNRHDADYLDISRQIKEFITIDDNWLNV